MDQKTLQEITLIDRTGTNSTKWDDLRASFGEDGLLPVWVADMDFKTPLCVRQALHEAVDQGAFGYYKHQCTIPFIASSVIPVVEPCIVHYAKRRVCIRLIWKIWNRKSQGNM